MPIEVQPSDRRRCPGSDDAFSPQKARAENGDGFAPQAAPARSDVPQLSTLRSRLLVIGYGNSLFADDGVGPIVAQQVADWCEPGVLALERHELVPELAAEMAVAEEVIFVDAAIAGERVSLVKLPWETIDGGSASLDHALSPAGLLRLTHLAFGRSPRAWMLTIPGADFSLGSALSSQAREGIAEALALLRQRI